MVEHFKELCKFQGHMGIQIPIGQISHNAIAMIVVRVTMTKTFGYLLSNTSVSIGSTFSSTS